MVLRIWLMVLVLSTLYYGGRLYGEDLIHNDEVDYSHSYKLNYDD